MTASHVVITRPLAQASALAAQVSAQGRRVTIFPLLDILPLADQGKLQETLQSLDRYALIAFVSPNAIAAAMAARPDWPTHIPLAVVGEGSRAALAEYGIDDSNCMIHRPRDATRSDSETLLQTLDLPSLRDRDVLIVRGETGRELLGDALRAVGARVHTVAAYRRAAPAATFERLQELRQLLDGQSQWLVTSSEALRFWKQLAAQADPEQGVAKMQHQQLIVPHARIAETARSLGFSRVILTASGDEGLLAALQSST